MSVRIEDVYAKKKTDKALVCVIEGDEYIIPDSQITEDSEVWQEGQTGELVITDWIAAKKGLD